MWTQKAWRCKPHHSQCIRGDSTSRRVVQPGFTLIELLVVVAIIALLVSILLPSLRGARESARAIVCGQKLRDFGNGVNIYFTENKDWLPGVNTTGIQLEYLRHDSFVPNLYEPAMPVQTWDWLTPLLAVQMELPPVRADKFKMLMEDFRCASQSYNAVPYPESSAIDEDKFDDLVLPAVSYLMPVHFQYLGQHQTGTSFGTYKGMPFAKFYGKVAPASWEVVVDDYWPRIDWVGQPADKIFVADGTRFLAASGLLDYDFDLRPNWFGTFTTSGAWWCGSTAYGVRNGSPNWDGDAVGAGSAPPGQGENMGLSYRHSSFAGTISGDCHDNNGTIEAVFYDGHVERMRDKQSREVGLWYPKGAIVQEPGEGMTTLPEGFVIP